MRTMNTKFRSLLCTILLALAINIGSVSAQTTTSVAVSVDPLAALPASDLVIFADVRRIMTQLAPHILASDPAMLAKVTGALEMAKAKTGINVMGIERVAVGVRLLGPIAPNFKKESVGIAIVAHGDFDANALIAFAKTETKGKISEQNYGGKVIYHEPPPEPPRTRSERETPAFSVLDANTLLVGDLVQVRAAIDAAAGTNRIDADLTRRATLDPNAIIGFAISLSPQFNETLSASAGPDEIMRAGMRFALSNIKQVSGSAGVAPGSFIMTLGVRFCDAQQAQSVNDLLTAARRKFAGSDPRISGLLEGVQVTTEGSDLQVKADIKGEVMKNLAAMFAAKRKQEESAASAAKPAAQTAPAKSKTTKRRRGTRRRGR